MREISIRRSSSTMCRLSLLIYSTAFFSIAYSQNLGDIRLVGGLCRMRGRLEVYYNGEWGTVCDDNFDNKDAMVVCRQLGSSNGNKAHFYTAGDGTGPIWIDGLSCRGHETSILSCSKRSIGSSSCSHAEDVGVWCFEAEEGDLRIVDGDSVTSGRLEIFHNGLWGTICDDAFEHNDAVVACRQLKLGTSSVTFFTASSGNGTIWIDNLACGGHESSIDACTHNGWGNHNCGHNEDVGITCAGSFQFVQGDLRLVEGTGSWDGRLEVFYSGSWGTVCDDGFGTADAKVACRQLRFSSEEASFYTAGNGHESEYINLDDLTCTGNENRLDSCSHSGWRIENCGHSEDVGLKCNEKCIVDGSWGKWASWTKCSTSCGNGTQERFRICDDPTPLSGGLYCPGNAQEHQDCQQHPCPVNGSWSQWTGWAACSQTCGSGIRIRQRLCDDPEPLYGGEYCEGQHNESSSCLIRICPVNGGWSTWSLWNACNETCGEGVRNRTRACDSPAPAFGGSNCVGEITDTQSCYSLTCLSVKNSKIVQDRPLLTTEMLAGIMAAVIVLSALISSTIVYIILRRRRRGENADQNPCIRELEEPRRRSNEYTTDIPTCSSVPEEDYESVDRNKPKSCIYDSCNSTDLNYENQVFDDKPEDDLYENLKLPVAQ